MAHLHFKRTVYKSGGSSARQRIEYITRQHGHAETLDAAERQLRYLREGREDLVYERSRNLPDWSHGNPHIYFQAAERYERKGGVAFEEWKISLPQELRHRQNMEVTRDLVDAIAGDKLPITYAFHDPRTLDEQHQQPHLHLLISARKNDGIARTAAQHFKRWNAQHPERGGAQKDDAFRHMGSVKAHRVLIADILNARLERAGQAMRVHPDSLHDRGIDRKPEPKLLPSESRLYREQGVVTSTMQQVLAIRAERAQQLAKEQNNAHAYWERRKTELGITRDLPMAHKLERVTQARAQMMTRVPERQTQGPERTIAPQRQASTPTLGQTQAPTRQRASKHMTDLARMTQRLRDLVRSMGRGDEHQGGAGLRIKLHDWEKERQQDQGRDLGIGF